MKKFLSIVIVIIMSIAVVLFGSLSSGAVTNMKTKKPCTGYNIIEANKGINCNGDTILLIKRHGFYEVASRYETKTNSSTAIN